VKRVVVTGLGVLSPIGQNRDLFWQSLKEGRCGIGPITNIAADKLNIRIAAEIKDFDPKAHFESKRIGVLDRVSQLGVVAAREALRDSGLDLTERLTEQTATIIGTGVGGMHTLDDSFQRIYGDQRANRVHPFTIPRLMVNAATSHITMDLGLTGPAFSVASACASATHAIGQAFALVRAGMTPIALTGGTESCITFGTMRGWEAMRVMSADTCRPFSKGRSGMVLGEGAACLVLEERNHACARGARIYGELAGFGMTADARDITAPDVHGASRAIAAALSDAGLTPEDVDYVNAHGTGTAANDHTETLALHRVFGEHARRLQISSCKSMFGHALGAAGALEMVATALAIHHGVIPPTINFLDRDLACDLDYVPNETRQAAIGVALSNSFAFGGLNAVLALKRFTD